MPARAAAVQPALITSPDEAVNVFDFEPVAERNLTPPHWTYLDMGVDDEWTLRENRRAFQDIQFRPKRFVDLAGLDTSTEILGSKFSSPIMLAPVSSQRAFHPDAELAVARAAGARGHHQILSTLTTSPIEDVNTALGSPVWFQLYPSRDWAVTKGLLRRAENAGCRVVAVTVDLPATNRERIRRFHRSDNEQCAPCHQPGSSRSRQRMFDEIDASGELDGPGPSFTMDFIKRIQDSTSMQLMVKGISTGEDALRCVDNGIAGIVVSNHGGRAEASGRSTIGALPEVIAAVDGRFPVLIDSGFRRGTDIFKALALGASAVCIGRPYLWGLAAFGQAGVARVLELLQDELEIVMRQAGTPTLPDIGTASLEFRHV